MGNGPRAASIVGKDHQGVLAALERCRYSRNVPSGTWIFSVSDGPRHTVGVDVCQRKASFRREVGSITEEAYGPLTRGGVKTLDGNESQRFLLGRLAERVLGLFIIPPHYPDRFN